METRPTPDDEARRFWEARYERHAHAWSGRPNAVLVDETADLRPGRALDLGCGEGSDAVWLAERGWDVTATDVSPTALERGAAAAAHAGVSSRLDWQQHDLAATFPAGRYALVTSHYMHAPDGSLDERILTQAAAAVAPGGTLLVVGHAAVPPWGSNGTAFLPAPADVLAALGLPAPGWRVVACDARSRQATGPHGEIGDLVDSVVKAVRVA